MDSILRFLQTYKELDELCKQIFFPGGDKDARGISEYIAEMEAVQGGDVVRNWQKDYRMLKHLRYVRNKLVHEPDSFEESLFTEEDIRALADFRQRILARTDPLAEYRAKKSASPWSRRPRGERVGASAKKGAFGFLLLAAGAIVLLILSIVLVTFWR